MPDSSIQLRIIGPDSAKQEVPASVLLQTLEGLQQLVWQFAHSREGGQLRQRLKFPADLKERFTLHLSPATPGSYIVHGRVGGITDDLVNPVVAADVVHDITNFCAAAVHGQKADIARLLPDRALRSRALDCLRSIAPLPGSGYRTELRNSNGPAINLTETLQADLNRLFSDAENEETDEPVQVVTGKLIEVNFDEHSLKIFYKPTRRQLTCEYDETVEPLLFENRRDFIQVRGKVRLGADNHPESIVDADYIGDLDLSPFILHDIDFQGLRLRFKRPHLVEPKLDETQQLICLHDPNLNLSAHAALRSELFEEVRACVHLLWTEFAREDDAKLDSAARELKQRMLAQIEEVAGA